MTVISGKGIAVASEMARLIVSFLLFDIIIFYH